MSILRKLRHKIAKGPVHKPLTWIRHRRLRPADVFVASYPRSGNTWLRFMLYEILIGQSSTFTNIHQLVPDVGKQGSALPVLANNGRLIKTHEAYLPLYHKAIYLVRDARDVALSEFAYQKALGLAEDDFDTYLPRFLGGQLNPFGAWSAHVDSWMDAKDKGYAEVFVVRFDEMRSQPEDCLADIMAFLNVPVERKIIRRAVANNSVERMQDKEKVNPQKASARGRFIRSGVVGGWRERFTETQAELVEKYAGSVLSRVGFREVESVNR
jgi:hypothetical protein